MDQPADGPRETPRLASGASGAGSLPSYVPAQNT